MEFTRAYIAGPLASMGLVVSLALAGCGSSEHPTSLESGSGGASSGSGGSGGAPDRCARPMDGCPCEENGLEYDCGSLVEEHGDYITCQMGTRTCEGGKWSECRGDRITLKSVTQKATGGLRPLTPNTLGTPEECPEDDPDTPEDEAIDACDPYCNHTTDAPGGIMPDPGPGFSDDPGGLTLVETGVGNCTSLTLTPSETTLTVTDFSPIDVTPSDTVTFTLTADPPGCTTLPFDTTWALDELDRATISGSDNTDGAMQLVVPIAGPIQVTAYAKGLSASVDIGIKVNVWEVPATGAAAAPNEEANASDAAEFGTWDAPAPGSEASQAWFLYPYENTYFPLGLPPPVVQYWYQSTGNGSPSEVRVSLRWPVDSSSDPAAANYSDFNYSYIVEESNAAASSVTSGPSYNIIDPQVVLEDLPWDYFEQSARGDDADIVIQRRRSISGTDPIDTELRRPIHFVDGQLKGTVYYNSYSSPQGGNTGAVLSIAPGATTPTLAVQPGGDCTVCHTVNLAGTSLITNTTGGPSSRVNESQRFDITTAGPSPTVQNTYLGEDWPTVTRFGAGPNVGITGTFPSDATGTITIQRAGDRGWARFGWVYGAYSGNWVSTNNTVVLGGSGLTANFNWGYYSWGTTYTWTGVQGTNTGQYWAMTPGDRFTFGAPFDDGSLYMTHGGRVVGSVGVGDPNFRAPNDYSGLYGVSDPNTRIGVTGWPANMLAVTPKFSPGGDLLAFGYWGGDDLPASPAGTLSSDAAGTRLAVVDFTCSAPPCDSASTGFAVENARDLTPGVAERVGWPAVTPSGTGVVYQRVYRTSKSASEDASGVIGAPGWGSLWPGWSPSHLNSSAGALGELWYSNVPATSATAATPTRLLALNGLDSGGVSYLPEDIRPVSPVSAHHRNAGTTFGITQADACNNTGTAANNYDYRLNYLPSVNPTESGGFAWVVFTSRRMYGNVAIDDPWDAKYAMYCSSKTPPTKKLWVAAIDPSAGPGTDPSYPAFYLPGQELMAGNANGYWVSSPCSAVNATCTTDDDCCDGTGSAPTTQCKVVDASVFPPSRQCRSVSDCSAQGGECTTDADCCTGLFCPAGGGACLLEPIPIFEPQIFEREYIAECPDDSHVSWRFFEWQASTPVDTSIEFFVQTKEEAADMYAPMVPLALSVADDPAALPPPTWYRGPDTVEEALWTASPPQRSKTYLKVTMAFNPDPAGTVAPTLYAWRQIFDCLPNE